MSVDSDIQVKMFAPARPIVQVKTPAPLAFKLNAGVAGGSSSGTVKPISFEQIATRNGAQTFTLPQIVASGWNSLLINGLRQAVTQYTVSGNALSLPAGLSVMIGDLITFDFYPL